MITRRSFLREGTTALVVGASGGMLPRAFAAGAGTLSRYRDQVLSQHPVGYWQFAEHDRARDLSGHGQEGSYVGGVAFEPMAAIRGDSAVAVKLNGVDAFIEVPDSEAFSVAASGEGLTVEVWMRPDRLEFTGQTPQHYVHWLGKGEAGAFEWGLRFYSQESPRPNRVSAYLWNPVSEPGVRNEGAGAYFQDALQANGWMHVVACYDPGDAGTPGAGVSIYRDGRFRAGPVKSRGARYASYDIHPRHGRAPLRLGTRDRGSFLCGALAEVAIYPRVLSAAQIADHYLAATR